MGCQMLSISKLKMLGVALSLSEHGRRLMGEDPRRLNAPRYVGTVPTSSKTAWTVLNNRKIATEALSSDSGSAVTLPTRMNNVPHEREMRGFFYNDAAAAVQTALEDGHSRLSVLLTIPETNAERDVYRVGTVLELTRAIVLSLAQDGASVKVCVQQALGEGVFQGLPLSLVGVRRIMEDMDWGDGKDFLKFGEIGSWEVDDVCSYYVLVAPQNVVGSTIMTDLEEMAAKAEANGKKLILINARLRDVPSAGGVMGVRGRKERIELSNSFVVAYHFRLLYTSGTYFPIKGALRYRYGEKWQLFKRMTYGKKEEGYELCESFDTQPDGGNITSAIRKKTKSDRTSM